MSSKSPSMFFVANANEPAISFPIFLRWVDCVAQILRIYPISFEFSLAYLVEYLDCVISSQFGNFLCNNERERQKAEIADSYLCIWVYLKQLRISFEESKDHEHYNNKYSPDKHPGALFPQEADLAPTLWSRFHLRWASPSEI